jgi:hypothetical protein
VEIKNGTIRFNVKYRELIGDRLSESGWSLSRGFLRADDVDC